MKWAVWLPDLEYFTAENDFSTTQHHFSRRLLMMLSYRQITSVLSFAVSNSCKIITQYPRRLVRSEL